MAGSGDVLWQLQLLSAMQAFLGLAIGIGIGFLVASFFWTRRRPSLESRLTEQHDLLEGVRQDLAAIQEVPVSIGESVKSLLDEHQALFTKRLERYLADLRDSTSTKDELSELRRLLAREAAIRTDAYQTIEVVSEAITQIEDAGDLLVCEFMKYQTARRSYSGGRALGGLMRAVIGFVNRWSSTRLDLDKVLSRYQAMRNDLGDPSVINP